MKDPCCNGIYSGRIKLPVNNSHPFLKAVFAAMQWVQANFRQWIILLFLLHFMHNIETQST